MILHPPNKAEAIAYVDGKGKFPGRYATVGFYGASENPPVYMHYKVGPLEVDDEDIKIVPMLGKDEVPYNKRPYDPAEAKEIIIFTLKQLEEMPNLLEDSFDNAKPFEDLTVMPNGPYTDKDGRRLSRITIGMRGLGDKDFDFFNILPLTLKLYHGGQNVSEWYTFDYYYLNQGPFTNATYLNAAFYWGMIDKVQIPKGSRQTIKELTFPRRDVYKPLRKNAELPSAKTYEPHGPRYTVSGHTVSWMGWTFSVITNQLRGPSVYNVKFKGERIVYENSLNEIVLVYSADGAGQDNMVYIDSMYGIGDIKRVIPGVDCPEYATLLNITKWDPYTSESIIVPGICIFEADGQEALWRHAGNTFTTGLSNKYLIARIPATVGNYDYIFDFSFHLDGKMQNLVTATGFIQGSFWNPLSSYFGNTTSESAFGYKVSSTAIGLIHDHTFGFKVDLDVIDEKNNFNLIHWKYGSINDLNMKLKINDSSYFIYNHTRYIELERLKKETGLKVDLINQKLWIVVNDKHKNSWGAPRGYRIVPMATGAQNLENDFPFMKDISFTNYHCAITKRKENELYVRPVHELVRDSDPNKPKRYLEGHDRWGGY
ncbi:hypothetical protein KUTeg_006683 [Tegillarca granosa]|uniref:Amine oxidase n=1 Tax=Tegillarca granosa TaxID=220873 RepID=A0ABQ9FFT3_TEGGR|nr:hypothetical protein KUTeg_006683 [Tegillarca granosa]